MVGKTCHPIHILLFMAKKPEALYAAKESFEWIVKNMQPYLLVAGRSETADFIQRQRGAEISTFFGNCLQLVYNVLHASIESLEKAKG